MKNVEDDYEPFLLATALAPLGLAFPDAIQIVLCFTVFLICGSIFLLRYFKALHATHQSLLKFLGPLLAITLLDLWIFTSGMNLVPLISTLIKIGAGISMLFIWGMALSIFFRKLL